MSTSTATAIALATLEPTWGQALRVWWSWQWRTLVTALVLYIVCIPVMMVTTQILSMSIFTLSGIFQMKTVLDKEYKTFRVAILPKATS